MTTSVTESSAILERLIREAPVDTLSQISGIYEDLAKDTGSEYYTAVVELLDAVVDMIRADLAEQEK